MQRIDILFYWHTVKSKIRAVLFNAFFTTTFTSIGYNFKFFGGKFITVGLNCRVYDNCWFQCIDKYKGIEYKPHLSLGRNVFLGDSVHISCVQRIEIDDDVLIGSRVYIGDHSHGSTKAGSVQILVPPALRLLEDSAPVYIGKRVWIGDGVVILAGSHIPDDSIIGANSVVKSVFQESAIIGGIPARVIRKLS